MTTTVNNLSNDVLRKIMYQVSTGPKQIIDNQLVCRKWYGLYQNQMFWKTMYIRDFGKEGIEQFSDIANFKLIYQKKKTDTIDDETNYIQIDQLTPENLVFGPVQKMYSNDIVIPVHFINWQTNNIAPRPFTVRGSGFEIEMSIPNQRYYNRQITYSIIKTCPDFKIMVNQLTRYLVKHHEEIWTHGKSNVYFSNGRQYNTVSSVLDCDSTSIARGTSHDKLTINIIPCGWETSQPVSYSTRVSYMCSTHNKMEKVSSNSTSSCLFKQSKTVKTNATLEWTFGGFTVNTKTNEININMKITKIWV